MEKLVEGEDFYYNVDGYTVLTAAFHLKKGICCGNGCLHCPYLYVNVPEALKPALIQKQQLYNASQIKSKK